MKTISLRNAGSTINASIKVDIFATNAQLMTPGFDTRFTNMEIGTGYKDSDTAIALLGQIQEIEENWQSVIALAESIADIGLYLSDMNEQLGPQTQEVDVTLTGTSGTANITVDGVAYLATWDTDLTETANDFVTSHAAALLAAGIVVTATTGVLKFVANVSGVPFSIKIANATLTLNGTVATIVYNIDAAGEVQVVMPL